MVPTEVDCDDALAVADESECMCVTHGFSVNAVCVVCGVEGFVGFVSEFVKKIGGVEELLLV